MRAARHLVFGLLDSDSRTSDLGLANDAAIVVTELAANAVLRADSGFTLTISRSAKSLRISVRDCRPLAPRNDNAPFAVQTGHGLSVVAKIASEWAVERVPNGKVVWAELATG